jgi:hypothetical protein
MWGGEEGHGQEASHLSWIYLFKLLIFFTEHYSLFVIMCTHLLILLIGWGAFQSSIFFFCNEPLLLTH